MLIRYYKGDPGTFLLSYKGLYTPYNTTLACVPVLSQVSPLVGLALKEWPANAGTVENLSIGADMLSQIITWIGGQNHVGGKA